MTGYGVIEILNKTSENSWSFLKKVTEEYNNKQEVLKTDKQDLNEGAKIDEDKVTVKSDGIVVQKGNALPQEPPLRFLYGISQVKPVLKTDRMKKLNENLKYIIKEIYGIDICQRPVDIVESLDKEISSEKEFKANIYEDQDRKDVVINYSVLENENKITRLCLAAGLPNEDFERAEMVYLTKVKDNEEKGKTDYQYSLQGYGLGGAFATYTGVMSDSYMSGVVEYQEEDSENNELKLTCNYQVINYNTMGCGNFLEFRGNEFFGYKLGIFYFLKKLLERDKTMDTILYDLMEKGVIINGNISSKFRKNAGQSLDIEKVTKVLIEILKERLSLDEEKAVNFVSNNMNHLIIERKMRFIDAYKNYQARIKTSGSKENIINYLSSDNLCSKLFKQIGSTYIVDQGLKMKEPVLEENYMKIIGSLEQNDLKKLIEPAMDIFEPYLYVLPDPHDKGRKNRLGEDAKIGNVTDKLSLDYLKALVRDVVHDLKGKDPEALKKLFWFHRAQSPAAMLEVIKDRLRYSMVLQKKLPDEISVFRNP
ncbi:MAG: hypothetical protein GX175_06070, partial [Halanaerobiaceae bacterium]|nr:hypothetical protein [Halanaerobiaceae bacterium]